MEIVVFLVWFCFVSWVVFCLGFFGYFWVWEGRVKRNGVGGEPGHELRRNLRKKNKPIINKERLLPYMNSKATHVVYSAYLVVLSLESIVLQLSCLLTTQWKCLMGGAKENYHEKLDPLDLAPVFAIELKNRWVWVCSDQSLALFENIP